METSEEKDQLRSGQGMDENKIGRRWRMAIFGSLL